MLARQAPSRVQLKLDLTFCLRRLPSLGCVRKRRAGLVIFLREAVEPETTTMTTSHRDIHIHNSDHRHSKLVTSERTNSTASISSDRFDYFNWHLLQEEGSDDELFEEKISESCNQHHKFVLPSSGERPSCVIEDFSSTDDSTTASCLSWNETNGSTTVAPVLLLDNATATNNYNHNDNTYGPVQRKTRTKNTASSLATPTTTTLSSSSKLGVIPLTDLPCKVPKKNVGSSSVFTRWLTPCLPSRQKQKKQRGTAKFASSLNGNIIASPSNHPRAVFVIIRRMIEAAVSEITIEVGKAQRNSEAAARRRKLTRTLRTLRAVSVWNEEFYRQQMTIAQQQQQLQQHILHPSSPSSLYHQSYLCYRNKKINNSNCKNTRRYHTEQNARYSNSTRTHISLRELVGDYGVTLFDPLGDEAIRPYLVATRDIVDNNSIRDCEEKKEQEVNVVTRAPMPFASKENRCLSTDVQLSKKGGDKVDEIRHACNSSDEGTVENISDSHDECDTDSIGYIFKHEVYPIQIEPEDETTLHYAPRLISDSMFQELVDDAMPRNLRMYKWKRIFSIARDGDAFITMIEKCSAYKHTLIVIKTTKGHTLGGFASEPWKNQDGFNKRHSYFGTGICFLFTDHLPEGSSDHGNSSNDDDRATTDDDKKQLVTYKWSGVNDYCQICDVDRRKIAMGGGEGDFGIIVEDSFLRGSSGHCGTFDNPPLIPGIDGTFDILGFEVYGLLPLIPTVTRSSCSSHTSRYSSRSLLKKL